MLDSCRRVNLDIVWRKDVLVFMVDEVEAIALVGSRIPTPDPNHQVISQL